MGKVIAYLMPTKCKIFLGKGALLPYNPCQGASPLDPCQHLAHRLSFPQLKIEWCPCISVRKGLMAVRGMSHPGEFKIGRSMECLIEMVQMKNSLRKYVHFTLWNGFSWAFKTLKSMSFGGSAPWTPRATMESPMKIVQFSAKLHVDFTPILPSKIFVGFYTRAVESPTLYLLLKWYKLKIHYKITYEFHPRFHPHKWVFLGFWIALKPIRFGGLRPGPPPGGWSLRWTVHCIRI